MSGSCITEDATTELYSKLREIESAMLGEEEENNNDDVDSWRWARTADAIRGGDVRQVLTLCARAVADGELVVAEWLVEELRRMVSVSGEPLQRLGAYMLEGLVARIAPSESSICRLGVGVGASASSELLHELCPYFKFAYMSANGAIAEAMRDEARVHIVDFRLGKGSQWETLIQAFAARPAGPPRIRITAVADDTHCVAAVARRLSRLAAAFAVPFEFRTVSDPRTLTLKGERGEEWAVAVNFAFALHRAADESVSTENLRDGLLRVARGMGPRVVTLVERESNANTSSFVARFEEALGHYGAVFESMDEALPRAHRGRIGVEQGCLAREVVNVVACEGAERVERHEVLGKWRSRLEMAGFRPRPLSHIVNATIARLLKGYSQRYCLEERDGALYLGWMDRFLVTSSAWQC